ncbi:class I adenylate-forming enzyme family protein [Halorarum halobium]|uniref:class I adenylate-forming enzyme family protein n=1 Tax=Halorarum halobium TaxID=3075121 RepID=UPI0028A5C036|nr:AMP-binding protein [Halobaculum sp. XH14]
MMRIEALLDRRVEKTPDGTFLTFPESSETYESVANRSKQYANALAERGIGAGDAVGLFLPNRPEFVYLMFATAYLDAVTAPANPEYRAGELEHSLTLSEPEVLVTTAELVDVAVEAAAGTGVYEILLVDELDGYEELPALADEQPTTVEPNDGDPTAVGLHMYTSGTTGPPKAVECQHENWTISAVDFQKRMGFTHEDTLFTALPLFHANAQVYSMLGAAAAGAEVIIYERFSSSNWWQWCREHDVTEFNAMGSMLKMLDNVPPSAVDETNPVEQVFSAGTPPELIEPFEERFDLRVVEGYSLTEDTMLILNPTSDEKRRIGSIGLPPAEKRVKIVDDEGEEVPRGTKGEILQQGPTLMAGYHGQPEKTAEVVDEDGWFSTGDYGKLDEDGFLYFLDRKKDIVRRGGENISSYEVEGVIKAIEAVEEVAVIPSPDEFYTEVVKATVTVKEGHDLAEEEIVERCRAELAPFKVPRYVEFVSEFPYTPTGKIQKQKLRSREKEEDVDHWERPE